MLLAVLLRAVLLLAVSPLVVLPLVVSPLVVLLLAVFAAALLAVQLDVHAAAGDAVALKAELELNVVTDLLQRKIRMVGLAKVASFVAVGLGHALGWLNLEDSANWTAQMLTLDLAQPEPGQEIGSRFGSIVTAKFVSF